MKKLGFEYWAPIVVWLGVIFLFSTDALSSRDTSEFFIPLLHFFFPAASMAHLEFVHDIIRKLGHITEYAILALLAYRTVRQDAEPMPSKVRTILFIVIAASSDEFHQTLTRFRTPSLVDVGYDTFGAVCALWLIHTYETWRIRTHSVL